MIPRILYTEVFNYIYLFNNQAIIRIFNSKYQVEVDLQAILTVCNEKLSITMKAKFNKFSLFLNLVEFGRILYNLLGMK